MTLALLAVLGLLAHLGAAAAVRRRSGRRVPTGSLVAAAVAAGLVVLAGLLPALLPVLLPAAPPDPPPGGHPGHAADHGAVAHMAQHVVLGMVAPVAVVAARPVRLLLALLPVAARPGLARVLRGRTGHLLTHPVVAAVPSVVGLHVLLLTPLYALSLHVGWVHALVLAHTLLAGVWLTAALVGGDPAPPRSSLLLRLAVLVGVGGLHDHLATLLYARAPRLPPGSPHGVGELRDAALVMSYGGDAAELLLAGAVVLAWYRRRAVLARRRSRVLAAREPVLRGRGVRP